jgi:hypothetical protein
MSPLNMTRRSQYIQVGLVLENEKETRTHTDVALGILAVQS